MRLPRGLTRDNNTETLVRSASFTPGIAEIFCDVHPFRWLQFFLNY
jgi:hypothetical protein